MSISKKAAHIESADVSFKFVPLVEQVLMAVDFIGIAGGLQHLIIKVDVYRKWRRFRMFYFFNEMSVLLALEIYCRNEYKKISNSNESMHDLKAEYCVQLPLKI